MLYNCLKYLNIIINMNQKISMSSATAVHVALRFSFHFEQPEIILSNINASRCEVQTWHFHHVKSTIFVVKSESTRIPYHIRFGTYGKFLFASFHYTDGSLTQQTHVEVIPGIVDGSTGGALFGEHLENVLGQVTRGSSFVLQNINTQTESVW